jgi:hypothetical protein
MATSILLIRFILFIYLSSEGMTWLMCVFNNVDFIRVVGLTCYSCKGWTGANPMASITTANTCDNMNHNCVASHFCVKMSDPMRNGAFYRTYTSECFAGNQLALAPGLATITIVNGMCYTVTTSPVPNRTYIHIFLFIKYDKNTNINSILIKICNANPYCWNESNWMIVSI